MPEVFPRKEQGGAFFVKLALMIGIRSTVKLEVPPAGFLCKLVCTDAGMKAAVLAPAGCN